MPGQAEEKGMALEAPTRSQPIGVCLVEDDDHFRAEVARWLGNVDGFHCVGTYPNAETGFPEVLHTKPHAVALDFGLPGMKGSACIRWLKQRVPETKVLVLTGIPNDYVVFESLAAGADGCLDKEGITAAKLLENLQDTLAGHAALSRRAVNLVLEQWKKFSPKTHLPYPLTPREKEVALLLADGLEDKQIAEKLGLSHYTVYNHVQHIFEKLQTHNRTEAALKLWGIK